jgi:predicted DNA binding CopG/RHH family protein
MEVDMREEYDFGGAAPNPYAKRLRKPVTIRLDLTTIDYFKEQAEAVGLPYQTLINLYLADCAANSRTLSLTWA